MKDYTQELLETGRYPDADAAVDFCLEMLYKDKKHTISDMVVRSLTFEELNGALLAARKELERRFEDELYRTYE